MASSALTCSRRYHVFPSFHGPDVRTRFLSHLHKHFESKGITTFKDQGIERGQRIGPELVQAIRQSRVSIVVLSKNYASSSWCLDELVEILKCQKDGGQIVMTIFYDVDPSHVRKQSDDFGIAFKKTCQGKTEMEKLRWSQALTYVAEIAGEHSIKWDDEARMVEKIAMNVSDRLNVTVSRDFEGMVGMEAHLRKLDSLLQLGNCDQVKMIGVWGPAGIGKTTIARALFSQLSSHFPLSCFLGNLKGSCRSIMGVDDYDMKLCLQSQFLSKILNQPNMKILNLGAVQEWLQDQRVLIVLDDVDDLQQLKVLAKEHSWFGNGSRIIVTTEDFKILKAHKINDVYHVDFPSEEEALKILCLSAFEQSSVQDGFEELAKKVAMLCGNLPLGLCVVGSSLLGETKAEWELQLSGLETNLDRKIEDVLRVGYDKLLMTHQSIFLHIACFFNNEDVDHVTSMLVDSNLDVRNGLKILAEKALVHTSTDGKIVMHYLLQKLGRQLVLQQSNEPGKRQFLVEAQDIMHVLANGTGTESVLGISFDVSKNRELSISRRAFEEMRNLQFLRVYMGDSSENVSLCTAEGMEFVPRLEDMEFLPRLRLLHWSSYPGISLPPTFRPESLIELHMPSSKLEKLWKGIQPLVNLKKLNLNFSFELKEIPNLSRATNLETLAFIQCTSLVKFPSSIMNLDRLKTVRMWGCNKLQVTDGRFYKKYSSRMSSFPDITRNIDNFWDGGPPFVVRRFPPKRLDVAGRDFKRLPHVPEHVRKLQDLSSSHIERIPAQTLASPSIVSRRSHHQRLDIAGRELTRLTHVPERVTRLDLSGSGIERIPDYISGLHRLQTLIIENCRKLISVEHLPSSLKSLHANNCASLERVEFSMFSQDSDSVRELMLRNCLRLDEQVTRVIINRRFAKYVCLPGEQVPSEFTHKATANSITVSPGDASSRFKACILLSPIKDNALLHVNCCLKSKEGVLINQVSCLAYNSGHSPQLRTQHLFILSGDLSLSRQQNKTPQVDVDTSEFLFEFTCTDNHKIVECGVQIFKEEVKKRNTEWPILKPGDKTTDHIDDYGNDDDGVCEPVGNISCQREKAEAVESTKHTDCWSFIVKSWNHLTGCN
ncbi:unnamed protein product [Microthlaspi erraticum]|uniref:ADP-ribosyl cyclase/cyclic ADP-ribose hydrolase n=1 Tax=Microthlaspi erraticum TaxID=1685480 RepID=A0A6D2ITN8_9BRAS|nr:unnamed protein product [Microthlaspi erraticum]